MNMYMHANKKKQSDKHQCHYLQRQKKKKYLGGLVLKTYFISVLHLR